MLKIKKLHYFVIFYLLVSAFFLFTTKSAYAADYVFPVIGPASYTNDFNGARFNGRHGATDIFANKHQKVVSRTNGVITQLEYPIGDTSSTAGWYVIVRADNGYRYLYLHLNNDNKGTDDGKATPSLAYGPDLAEGNRVIMGQLLGYVGDSGNAESTPPHLHFEIRDGSTQINPYKGLENNSYRISSPRHNYPQVGDEILPTGTKFFNGVSVSVGDVDGDSEPEIVTGARKGGRYFKVIELDGTVVQKVLPNPEKFTGGIDVATGDVDGDDVDEIVVGNGPGGTYVSVFEADGTEIERFRPNPESFRGGTDVATGDVDGDDVDEIITGMSSKGSAVKIYEADGTFIRKIKPFGSFKGGASVASGNTTGDDTDEIVVGAKSSGGPRLSVFSSDGELLHTQYVYSSTFKGGIMVASANITDDQPYDEILTIPQSKGSAKTRLHNGAGSFIRYSNNFDHEYWKGSYDISAYDDLVFGSLGVGRRSSVREVNGLDR